MDKGEAVLRDRSNVRLKVATHFGALVASERGPSIERGTGQYSCPAVGILSGNAKELGLAGVESWEEFSFLTNKV